MSFLHGSSIISAWWLVSSTLQVVRGEKNGANQTRDAAGGIPAEEVTRTEEEVSRKKQKV